MARAVADLTDPAVPETAPAPPRRRRKLVLVGVAVLLVAAGAAVFLRSGSDDSDPDAPAVEGAIVEVAQMTANLAGPAVHYARIGFAAVLAADVMPSDVEGRFPLMRDAALSEIGTLPADHLRTPEGVEELRNRLTARARSIYPDGQVLRIVLTELVVQ